MVKKVVFFAGKAAPGCKCILLSIQRTLSSLLLKDYIAKLVSRVSKHLELSAHFGACRPSVSLSMSLALSTKTRIQKTTCRCSSFQTTLYPSQKCLFRRLT